MQDGQLDQSGLAMESEHAGGLIGGGHRMLRSASRQTRSEIVLDYQVEARRRLFYERLCELEPEQRDLLGSHCR